jgi:hypothetical protein
VSTDLRLLSGKASRAGRYLGPGDSSKHSVLGKRPGILTACTKSLPASKRNSISVNDHVVVNCQSDCRRSDNEIGPPSDSGGVSLVTRLISVA